MEVLLVDPCYVDGFTGRLTTHPFVHDLATVAAKLIDTPLFDEYIKILIDILRDSEHFVSL